MKDWFPLLLWLLALLGLQAVSFLLDNYQYTSGGYLAMFLLKFGYLVSALVLLARYRSFSTQRNWESMLESYRVLSGGVEPPKLYRRKSPFRIWFYLFLVSAAVLGCIIHLNRWQAFSWPLGAGIDGLLWLAMGVWLVHSHWLRSTRRREIMKETLDDARSRAGMSNNLELPAASGSIGQLLFLSLFLLIPAALVSVQRVVAAPQRLETNNLKRCMHGHYGVEHRRMLDEGDLGLGHKQLDCHDAPAGSLLFEVRFSEGELLLEAIESPVSDYFDDGVQGNQGLRLSSDGSFKRIRMANPN